MAEQITRIREQGNVPIVPFTCFTPDTPKETVRLFTDFFRSIHSEDAKFQSNNRWSATATDGFGLANGDATTLTVSFPSDGISVLTGIDPGSYAPGEANTPNNLHASFDAEFGSTAAWKALLEDVFDKWSERAGLTYVFDVADDDADFPLSSGVLGLRGDIRIAGHTIDGPGSGILAYNYYPNTGDMVIDTGNTAGFFGVEGGNNYRALRNTISHEHGHGLGFRHVCPMDGTKLMEPFINVGFDHSAEDDIRHANRKYGDRFEKSGGNDIPAVATDLGVLTEGTHVVDDNLSIGTVNDVDWYQFTIASDANVALTLAPVGSTYNEGAQNAPSGSDSTGCATSVLSATNAAAILNLDLTFVDNDGVTVLQTAATADVGNDEILTTAGLPAGTYFVQIDTDDFLDRQVQMYSLTTEVASLLSVLSVEAVPSSTFAEEGEDFVLSAVTTGATPNTYQWMKNGGDLPGEQGQLLLLNDLVLSDSGSYQVRVTDSSKAPLTSSPYQLTVLPAGSLPVSGVAGLAFLTAACALGGSAWMRRRK
jgi:hypothetical protein